jgi:general secretion pathway protein J
MRRGFTLIELLIAMSLMAMIALALSGALGFGSRVWESGSRVADNQELVAASQAMLRRLIGQAAIGEGGAVAEDLPPLDGQGAALDFWATVPPYLGLGGRYRFSLRVEDIDQAPALVMLWRPQRGAADTPDRSVLLRGIEALDIAYLGLADESGRRDWQSLWDQDDALPALVSIQVRFPEGDGRVWPRLVIAPRLIP